MFNDFISGATAYFKAFGLISKHQLWGYFLAPAILSIVLGIGILGSAWLIADNIGALLIRYYPWELRKSIIELIISIFGGIFIVGIGFIIFKNLVIALASPFMSPLSEKIEAILTGSPHTAKFSVQKFIQDLIRGLTIAIRNVIRELFYTFLLFLLGLIPFFSPVSVVLIFLVQAYYAGFGNIDFLLERHFNVKGSVRFVRSNRWMAVGNGSVFLLLFLTGIGFLIALPLGTIAGTMEGLKNLDNGNQKLPSPQNGYV